MTVGSRSENEDEDGPSDNVEGVINMKDEVNSLRQKAVKKVYHEMEPVKVCIATGVEIK